MACARSRCLDIVIMTIGGMAIWRHEGWFYLYDQTSDAYPAPRGLRWELYEAIPKDPIKFKPWVEQERKRLSVFRQTYDLHIQKTGNCLLVV